MTSVGPTSAAILLAAGRGTRMRGAIEDKVLAPLAGQTVFHHSVAAFVLAGVVDQFVVVYRDPAQRARLERAWRRSPARKLAVTWVRGGQERRDSVARALAALVRLRHSGFVHIHDCARPLVHPDALRELDVAVRRDGAAVLAHRVTDTIKQVSAEATGESRPRRLKTIDRSRLWAMETPQAFAFDLIVNAYRNVQRHGLPVTDDAAALEATSRHGVTLVENSHPNPKLTTPPDLAYAEFLLAPGGGKT